MRAPKQRGMCRLGQKLALRTKLALWLIQARARRNVFSCGQSYRADALGITKYDVIPAHGAEVLPLRRSFPSGSGGWFCLLEGVLCGRHTRGLAVSG